MSGLTPFQLAYDVINLENYSNDATIILVHGATSSKETWHKILKILADKTGMKIYAIDLRNHGNSPWSNDFSIDIMVKDLENFMDQHEINSAILLGHSFGGLLTMYFSLQKPNRVKKLIIEDATMKPSNDDVYKTLLSNLKLMKIIPQQIPPELDLETAKRIASDLIESCLPVELRRDPKLRDESSLSLIKENGVFKWKANIEALEKFLPTVILDIKVLESICPIYDKPTLFIYGVRSVVPVLKDKDYHLKFFPQAIFKPLESTGHSLHTDYPDEFCEVVRHFVI